MASHRKEETGEGMRAGRGTRNEHRPVRSSGEVSVTRVGLARWVRKKKFDHFGKLMHKKYLSGRDVQRFEDLTGEYIEMEQLRTEKRNPGKCVE